VAVAEVGAWRYSFVYELIDRHFPDLPQAARPIGRAQARCHLLDLYLQSVGAATQAQMVSLFRWKPAEVQAALLALAESGRARAVESLAGQVAAWWLSTAL
jgi:uncharacterized protein YcaQ